MMTDLPNTPYATYAFYQERFGGSMSEADFDRYAGRATVYLATLLRREPKEAHLDALAGGCCAAADYLYQYENSVESAENDGLRVKYLPKAARSLTPEKALAYIAAFFLGDTGLLYLGI